MKLNLCKCAGCQELTTGYYCKKHKEEAERKAKERKPFENAQRFANYHNPEWTKLSKEIITLQPYCVYCGSITKLSVHHVVPVREAPERFLDRSNLIVVCESCHRLITRKEIEERKKRRREQR